MLGWLLVFYLILFGLCVWIPYSLASSIKSQYCFKNKKRVYLWSYYSSRHNPNYVVKVIRIDIKGLVEVRDTEKDRWYLTEDFLREFTTYQG